MEQEITLTDIIIKLKDSISLIQRFINNPTNTTKEIINANLTISNNFSEIETGLKGEFTNAKAVDLGKQYLLAYSKSLIEDAIKLNIDLKEYANRIATETLEHLDVIRRNIDMTIINRRRVRYEANNASMRYMTLKLKTVIDNYAREYDTPKQVVDFLYTIREVMSKTRLLDITEIEQIYKDYSVKQAILNSYVNNVTAANLDELPSMEVALLELDAKAQLTKYIQDIKVVDPVSDNDSIPMLNNIIDGLDRTGEDLKRNVETFRDKVCTIQQDTTLFSNYLNGLYTNVIEPYVKQSLFEIFNNKQKAVQTRLGQI